MDDECWKIRYGIREKAPRSPMRTRFDRTVAHAKRDRKLARQSSGASPSRPGGGRAQASPRKMRRLSASVVAEQAAQQQGVPDKPGQRRQDFGRVARVRGQRSSYPTTSPVADPRISNDPEHNLNWLFHTNQTCSKPNGDILDRLHRDLGASYSRALRRRGYLEWMFPLPGAKPSTNPHAQQLFTHESEAIIGDVEASRRVLRSYVLFLNMIGLCVEDAGTGTVGRHPVLWTRYGPRTLNKEPHLRDAVGRVLRCLPHMGFAIYQRPFLECLEEEATSPHGGYGKCRRSLNSTWRAAAKASARAPQTSVLLRPEHAEVLKGELSGLSFFLTPEDSIVGAAAPAGADPCAGAPPPASSRRSSASVPGDAAVQARRAKRQNMRRKESNKQLLAGHPAAVFKGSTRYIQMILSDSNQQRCDNDQDLLEQLEQKEPTSK